VLLDSTEKSGVREADVANERSARFGDGLHYFLIHAYARRRAEGAYVGCWVNFRLYEGALLLARFYIREAGWIIRSVDEHRWYELADVPTTGRKYFKEAKEDGASFVFHSYPKRHAKRTKR